MSIALHNAVIRSLKEARAAFFAGDLREYGSQMKAAYAGIEAIASLGMPLDGSTGRPVEVLELKGEYAIQEALPLLAKPAQAVVRYQIADVSLVSLFKSKVVTAADPWMPAPESLLAFWGTQEEQTGALDEAARLYAKLTGGGGGGVAELYRAELAQHRGDAGLAVQYARRAMEAVTGDQWVVPAAAAVLHAQRGATKG